MLREKTPTAGVLSQNTRAEYRAAELERVLKEDFAFQNKAHSLKTGSPEMDSCKESLESGLREEQFRQDHRITSCLFFSYLQKCISYILRCNRSGIAGFPRFGQVWLLGMPCKMDRCEVWMGL